MKDRRRGLAAAMLWLGLAGSAAAAPPVITQPDWVRRPDGDSLARHYPPLADELALSGDAVISCTVNAQGQLTDCHASAERPAGLGFGQAAIDMAADFQMRPQTVNGRPVEGGSVRIPIRFVSPVSVPPSPLPPPVSDEAARQALRVVDSAKMLDRALESFESRAKKIERMRVEPTIASDAADAFRQAYKAHREDLRAGFAKAFASVFSEAEMAATADFNLASGDQGKNNDGFAKVQGLLSRDYGRAMVVAARTAFCAKAACVGPDEVQRVWRASDPRDTSRIDNPQWARQPSFGELLRGAPKVTTRLGLIGVVRLACRVAAKGDLTDCAIEDQAPAGLGYGQAALEITGDYRLSPIQVMAGAVGHRVVVRVGFPPVELPELFRATVGSSRALILARQITPERQVSDAVTLKTEIEIADYATNPPKGADTKVYEAAVDAYRTGAKQALADYLAMSWSNVSSAYPEPELERRAAFHATPAGKAQQERSKELGIALNNAENGVAATILADAHANFCKRRDCSLPSAVSPQPSSAASSAPSTRTP